MFALWHTSPHHIPVLYFYFSLYVTLNTDIFWLWRRGLEMMTGSCVPTGGRRGVYGCCEATLPILCVLPATRDLLAACSMSLWQKQIWSLSYEVQIAFSRTGGISCSLQRVWSCSHIHEQEEANTSSAKLQTILRTYSQLSRSKWAEEMVLTSTSGLSFKQSVSG